MNPEGVNPRHVCTHARTRTSPCTALWLLSQGRNGDGVCQLCSPNYIFFLKEGLVQNTCGPELRDSKAVVQAVVTQTACKFEGSGTWEKARPGRSWGTPPTAALTPEMELPTRGWGQFGIWQLISFSRALRIWGQGKRGPDIFLMPREAEYLAWCWGQRALKSRSQAQNQGLTSLAGATSSLRTNFLSCKPKMVTLARVDKWCI